MLVEDSNPENARIMRKENADAMTGPAVCPKKVTGQISLDHEASLSYCASGCCWLHAKGDMLLVTNNFCPVLKCYLINLKAINSIHAPSNLCWLWVTCQLDSSSSTTVIWLITFKTFWLFGSSSSQQSKSHFALIAATGFSEGSNQGPLIAGDLLASSVCNCMWHYYSALKFVNFFLSCGFKSIQLHIPTRLRARGCVSDVSPRVRV
jgi:hypothetical protein